MTIFRGEKDLTLLGETNSEIVNSVENNCFCQVVVMFFIWPLTVDENTAKLTFYRNREPY